MMHRQQFLVEAIGETGGRSRSTLALCSAIVDDAEMAREFEFESRGALELLHAVMPGTACSYRESSLSPRELTSLMG